MLINGQSGRVEGDYPKSPAKIAAIAAAVLAIVILVYLLSGDGDRRRASVSDALWAAQTGEAVEDTEWTTELEDEEEVPWVYLEDSLPT